MNDIFHHLNFERIEFSFYSKTAIKMNYWIGSVLRSRFLNHAEHTYDERGKSLRTIIGTLPLPESHFMYKQWKGGFPKGYVLDCSTIPYEHPGFILKANTIYTFNLFLIGNFAAFSEMFVSTIKSMLDEGIDYSPLHIVDIIRERPYSFSESESDSRPHRLSIQFLTPVNLLHIQNESVSGFQGKLNNFPSFYQIMRSATFRLLSLTMLYTNNHHCFSSRDEMEDFIDKYIERAISPTLSYANIRLEKRYSTPKSGKKDLYTLEGYTGKMNFNEVSSSYINLLEFASALNLGTDINYGLGTFRIRIAD